MSKLQIYPVTVNDYIPFICFIVEESSELALKLAEERFPSLKMMGDLELLNPISIDKKTTFVIDPELYIIEKDDEIKYWLGDSGVHYDNNSNAHFTELLDDALPTKESEDKDVKLLPAKSSTKITDGKDGKDSDETAEESGENSSEEEDEEKDKTVWV